MSEANKDGNITRSFFQIVKNLAQYLPSSLTMFIYKLYIFIMHF